MTTAERAPIENCDECGFGWDLFSDDQAVGALILAGEFFRDSLIGVDLALANTRPDPETWSILEYVDHVRKAMWIWRFVVDVVVGELDVDLSTQSAGTIAPEVQIFDDVAATIAAMESEAAELFSALLGLTPEQWDVTTTLSLGVVDQRWVVRHALHEVLHHLHDVGRIRARLGDGVPHQVGSIVQLNTSGGGVPKIPVDEAEVTGAGMAGDHQNDRIHHGRPFQALCLFSKDVIEALNVEGHPIYPGATGENVTVEGIDWASLRPGAVVALGYDVRIELSAYATPCAKNAAFFAERDFRRMSQQDHPGWSRIYATVLSPGHIRPGDQVIVEP